MYGRLPRNLSDDGRYLFFTTDEAKVPQDTNNLEDVYEYDAASGEVGLISPGTDVCGAVCGNVPENTNNPFGDASASGNDVFFITREPLVPADQDTEIIDIYDARVDGGLASQNPPPEQPAVHGRGLPWGIELPDLAAPASAGFVGKGNVSAKQNCNKLGSEAKKLSKRAKRLRKNAKQVRRPATQAAPRSGTRRPPASQSRRGTRARAPRTVGSPTGGRANDRAPTQ